MKAITVKQPYASLIVEPDEMNPGFGIKPIENRTWKCPQKYIGKRVLIHAGMDKKLMNIPPNTFLNDEQLGIILNKNVKFNDKDWNLYGCIIGSVEIVDCIINHPSIWAEKTDEHTVGWSSRPIYNWVLANPIKFDKPIPCKGKLSFWEFEG